MGGVSGYTRRTIYALTYAIGKGRPQYVALGRDIERTTYFGPLYKFSGRPFTSRRPMNIIRMSDSDTTSLQRRFYVRDEYGRPKTKEGRPLDVRELMPSGAISIVA